MRLKSSQAGIKMGTESMAPFEDIKISNCHIYDTKNGGIKLLTVDGAHLRNIEISDITMTEVRTPMLFRLGSRLNVFRKDQEHTAINRQFENVIIRNVKAKASDSAQLKPPSGILITGVPVIILLVLHWRISKLNCWVQVLLRTQDKLFRKQLINILK
jgi:polygalacturonase